MSKFSIREAIPKEAHEELASHSDIVRHLLFHRGITKKEEAEKFLRPNYDLHGHDPFAMKDMEKAVLRIEKAFSNNEKIAIFSDYDCDGIPAGVILHDFFKQIGYENFINYFPHRYEEGYGLNIPAIEEFKKEGVSLIITADCGTSDVLQVERANELGLDVIITDHHLSQETKIPPAYAILNPKQPDCAYPEKMLCGSGVIFKLIQALTTRLATSNWQLKTGQEKWLLDMVGLATMADMVPLQGENRVFAHYGLTVLRKSRRLGLKKLLEKSKVNQLHLCEDDIGFTIAPRINAASRMGEPSEAFRLLTASDEATAEELANYLNKINDERKGLAASMVKEIKKILSVRTKEEEKKVLVIGNPKWKPPLLGPVANNLSEMYSVPVFLWGRADGDCIKGSCRASGAVNVLELMKAAPTDLFLGYGGHKSSGGFSISHENVHRLETELVHAFDRVVGIQKEEEEIFIDMRLDLNAVNWNTYAHVEKLAPFGYGNSKPVFLLENIVPSDVRRFGKEENHLELVFRGERGNKIPAIGFFTTPEDFPKPPMKGEALNLVATIEKSMFRNFPELRLRIIDII
ncbi:MAG TPA: single-stranded-DNA-specific exonuclease RecJ [Candidatus Paceibacterota bacterium]